MELRLLTSTLEDPVILDTFDSLIWKDKYCGCGDFEIVLPITNSIVSSLHEDDYLLLDDSEEVMIVEFLGIRTNVELGNKAVVKGRSLESILDRRVAWDMFDAQGNLQDIVHLLLDTDAIDPVDTTRKISRLEFEESTDPIFDTLQTDVQSLGGYLYDIITSICMSKGIGYKITLTDAGKFKFKLYSGVDRSYDQTENPFVVFSPEYDNLRNSNYTETTLMQKTVTRIAGETGVGNERTLTSAAVSNGAGSDLARREMFTDAGAVSRNIPDAPPLTEEEYNLKLVERGKEDLSKNIFIKTFEGEADVTTNSFVFGEHFFLGDIVQIANEYGQEAPSRVVELIRSQDASGIRIVPTFGAT